ncbi:MAG: 3-deoxy-7-phosphoheptulonate synthase class II [Planctomycetes bacterium]|nr:3-deoxy-7-phosphoheptulonate synthase class II [Planctomycetota bacterium]
MKTEPSLSSPPDLEWSPSSWQRKPAAQQPAYPDPEALQRALEKLSRLPPLVTSWEVEALKKQLAEAQRGERFLLQGGDCAESFEECESSIIANKLKILLQMSLVLVHGLKKPVVRVGRFAGQYAKPRSADMETQDGMSLWSYRGDIVNHTGFTEADRRPDPELLLRGYERAALTLNFIRSLVDGGFADLHHPEAWDLAFVRHSPEAEAYHRIAESIGESIRFMELVGGASMADLNRVDFYASHEGLLLAYEQAQTRRVPRRTGWYNLSTHLPWIGDRTRSLDGAHVEYFRGIANPIGVKVGPSMTPEELTALVKVLNPHGEPGRLTLIHRFGAKRIEKHLPPLIGAVRRAGQAVLWCCDPMHGNTETTRDGIKTRDFQNITSELEQAFDIHEAEGSRLGGVHFELTGDNVTECTGGARGLSAQDLKRDYRSLVDPRLNYEQALEMAMLIARRIQRKKTGGTHG